MRSYCFTPYYLLFTPHGLFRGVSSEELLLYPLLLTLYSSRSFSLCPKMEDEGQEMVQKLPPVIISFADMSWNKTGSWRYLKPRYENKTPPCSMGCPAGEDIEGSLRLLAAGKIHRAWALIKMENPLPRVCGRVCFHPCESQCNRGQYDRPIAINILERFIAEVAGQRQIKVSKPKIRRLERIAVIGAGPAGLSCAYHLTRLGYPVLVFEALSQAGGMLRVVIIGGGNTALDVARSVLRLQSEPHILYRRTRKEMPAFGEEIIEAERCFHCGVCDNCENCFLYCPEGAIFPQETAPGYRVNYDYCKGCGICAEECPRNAIVLEEEER